MKRLVLLLVLALSLCVGCDDRSWWEYRDDPYLTDLATRGRQEVLRNVNSANREERQAALRIVAHQAGEARRRGKEAEADRLEEVLVRRYFDEKDAIVRACIVRICAPEVGRGGKRTVKFLRERMAAGEFPGYAALSLAALAPHEAFQDIDPLTRHPAPEIRLQAATALTVLGDPRGYDSAFRVWRSMTTPAWPDRVDGVPLAEAKTSLAVRIQRAFGRQLH